MIIKRKSIIWSVTKDKIQEMLDSSDSIVAVLEKFGLNAHNGNHRTLHERIKIDGLSLSKLTENRNIATKNKLAKIRDKYKLKDSDIFIENSRAHRGIVKRTVIKRNLIQYVCSECGNNGLHNLKKLSLQLDHINGIANDNRLNNLRFLCPNCHSQTKTYAGKRHKKHKIYETVEKKNSRIIKSRKFNISKDELQLLVNSKPMTQIAKIFGVSDNAIKKRCKLLGIILGNRRGYWTKVKCIKLLEHRPLNIKGDVLPL